MRVQIISKISKKRLKIKSSNNSSFAILIFVILKFRSIGRSTFDHSKFCTSPNKLKHSSHNATGKKYKWNCSLIFHIFLSLWEIIYKSNKYNVCSFLSIFIFVHFFTCSLTLAHEWCRNFSYWNLRQFHYFPIHTKFAVFAIY